MRQINLEQISKAYKDANELKKGHMHEGEEEMYTFYLGMTIAFKAIKDYMEEKDNELANVMFHETI